MGVFQIRLPSNPLASGATKAVYHYVIFKNRRVIFYGTLIEEDRKTVYCLVAKTLLFLPGLYLLFFLIKKVTKKSRLRPHPAFSHLLQKRREMDIILLKAKNLKKRLK